MVQQLAGKLDVNEAEAVHADGALFREHHEQYLRVCENGKANGGLWYNAYPAAKDICTRGKDEVVAAAVRNRQDLFVYDTGEKAPKMAPKLRAAGYQIHLLGIYADPLQILARGCARELEDGKRYHRSVPKLIAAFNCFLPAIKAVDGTFKIFENPTNEQPRLALEGMGCNGGQVPAAVSDALEKVLKASTERLLAVSEVAAERTCREHALEAEAAAAPCATPCPT